MNGDEDDRYTANLVARWRERRRTRLRAIVVYICSLAGAALIPPYVSLVAEHHPERMLDPLIAAPVILALVTAMAGQVLWWRFGHQPSFDSSGSIRRCASQLCLTVLPGR
ncbi:hypothetical protein CLV46_0886 [Diaminobutyricimonas aerilata]|uniref:Uncharacterized protein n=1 Tax=Diaminobutyricimonas aerilata TaxID=1162967 RepID=A0A2M9CHJ6_9MICO|nr:hypothetical protein [Diaminobutyricimonas aerilata]PJJ71342.1 hypothetical protein CLV46_0886 [Diaminobutyricimonas aerilata]